LLNALASLASANRRWSFGKWSVTFPVNWPSTADSGVVA